MAKGGKQKRNKNVFKVAGARSLKAKNKAKAVSTQLKKLSQVTKQKTVEVDKLLNDLQDIIRQTPAKKNKNEKPEASDGSNKRRDKIDQYSKTEEGSTQALDKLNKMEI